MTAKSISPCLAHPWSINCLWLSSRSKRPFPVLPSAFFPSLSPPHLTTPATPTPTQPQAHRFLAPAVAPARSTLPSFLGHPDAQPVFVFSGEPSSGLDCKLLPAPLKGRFNPFFCLVSPALEGTALAQYTGRQISMVV